MDTEDSAEGRREREKQPHRGGEEVERLNGMRERERKGKERKEGRKVKENWAPRVRQPLNYLPSTPFRPPPENVDEPDVVRIPLNVHKKAKKEKKRTIQLSLII